MNPPLPTNWRSPSRSSTRSSATSPAMPTRSVARAPRRPRDGADLVVFPELFIAGYPPEDLVLKPAFQAACRAAVEELARETATAVRRCWSARPGSRTASSTTPIALLDGGAHRGAALQGRSAELRRVRREARVRARADAGAGQFPRRADRRSDLRGHLGRRSRSSASPRPAAKSCWCRTARPIGAARPTQRLNVAVARVAEAGLPLVYVNQVGGQDELVFDGASFVLNADRSLAVQLPAFREAVAITHWERERRRLALRRRARWRRSRRATQADYAACVLGLRDYVDKNGFPGRRARPVRRHRLRRCARRMAVDALGAERVRCVMLPYRFTSQESLDDAAAVAKALGVQLRHRADRERGRRASKQALAPLFAGPPRDVTEENLQARARGTHPDGDLQQVRPDGGDDRQQVGNVGRLRHALRRHERRLQSDQGSLQDRGLSAVAPAQRLEAGGRARARRARSSRRTSSPRPPTAELRENQTDQDSLPPYDVLDAILERLVEREEPIAAIVAAGFDRDTVVRVERMLNLAEYKRRQAAPGVKVTLQNFGRDRRYPIINRFRDPGDAAAGARPRAGRRAGAAQERSVRFLKLSQRVSAPDRRSGRPCAPCAASAVDGSASALVRLGGGARLPAAARGCGGALAGPRAGRSLIGRPWASRGGCDSALARSSVTTMSPRSTVVSSARSERIGPALAGACGSCRPG